MELSQSTTQKKNSIFSSKTENHYTMRRNKEILQLRKNGIEAEKKEEEFHFDCPRKVPENWTVRVTN